MADPRLIIRIVGDSKKFRKELDKVEKETTKTTNIITKSSKTLTKGFNKQQKALSKTALEARKTRQELKRLAEAEKKAARATEKANAVREKRIALLKRTAVILGVLAVAGIAKSVIAFATFEQGLAGVSKTTNIVGKDLENLGKEITEISIKLGISSTRLLVLAKTVGQLGVQGSKNILKFTEVMAGLEKTTNITGETGAIALARLIKVTDELPDNVDRVASAIVGLGNTTAALEDQILFTATEIGGAGKAFEITAEQALGLAAAFSELAVRPELARSTILRAFGEIQKAISGGGKELETLITLTGLTGDALKKTFEEDATKVFGLFLEGVGKLPKSQIIPFLKDFNLGGLRLEATLPKLAIGAALVNEKLKDSSVLYKENAALTKELAIQLNTTASRAKQTREEYEAISRELGDKFIPATEDALEALRDLAPFIKENLIPALSFLIGFLIESVKGMKLFADGIGFVLSKIAEIEGIRTGFETGPVGTFLSLAKANDAVEKREKELEEILEKGFQARKERHERESIELEEFLNKQDEEKIQDAEKEAERERGIADLSEELRKEAREKKETEQEKEQEQFDKDAESLTKRLEKATATKDVFADMDLLRDLAKLKSRAKNAKDLTKVDEQLSIAQQKFSTQALTTQILNLDTLFGQETAVGKAIFILRKAQAIAGTITSTQEAMALARATVPPPGGDIVAAKYAVAGAINVGIIAGTAIQALSAQDGGQVPGGFGGGDKVPLLLEPGEIITPERLNPLSPNFDETFGGGAGPQEMKILIDLTDRASEIVTVNQREDATLGVQS